MTAYKEQKPIRNPFASDPKNVDVVNKNIENSKENEGIKKFKGTDPLVRLERQNKNFFRAGDMRVSLEQWCDLIYGWLMLNPQMISVSDYYAYLENAPFLYSLEQVLEFDSDKIYCLLQERIKTMMLRGKISREAALAVLREQFGWERDDKNVNLNVAPEVSFKFGGAIPVEKNT